MNNLSFDIFCQVVDNYGDIGVSWRLAKQLSQTPFNADVRLWVDNLAAFKKLQPKVIINKKSQFIENVEILLWDESNPKHTTIPKQVIIETFACELPKVFTDKLNKKNNIWLNLEYLSAENWVKDFHLQPSPQANGMVKYFFMPGFTSDTGGLIRENNLQKNLSKNELFKRLNIAEYINEDSLLVTYFSYDNARFDLLIKSLVNQKQNVSLLIPQGLKLNQTEPNITASTGPVKPKDLEQLLGFDIPSNPQVFIIPFVDQVTFDQILSNADINFIRGEDSLVRAIWAHKPFIWQPYIQDEDTHLKKLNALLDISNFDFDIKQLFLSWSKLEESFTEKFNQALYTSNYKKWYDSNLKWSKQLANQTDLATALVEFIKTKHDHDIR